MPLLSVFDVWYWLLSSIELLLSSWLLCNLLKTSLRGWSANLGPLQVWIAGLGKCILHLNPLLLGYSDVLESAEVEICRRIVQILRSFAFIVVECLAYYRARQRFIMLIFRQAIEVLGLEYLLVIVNCAYYSCCIC